MTGLSSAMPPKPLVSRHFRSGHDGGVMLGTLSRMTLVRAVRHTLCSGRRGEQVAPRQTAERAAGQAPGAGGVDVAGARLLVIDDERRILDFVARGLRAEGYTVEVAEDGPQGLAE